MIEQDLEVLMELPNISMMMNQVLFLVKTGREKEIVKDILLIMDLNGILTIILP